MPDIKAQEKAERRVAKQAAAAEKATERQRIAQEKAATKAAEKAKLAQEKAVEKEKVAAFLRAEQGRAERDKSLKEKQQQLAVAEREHLVQGNIEPDVLAGSILQTKANVSRSGKRPDTGPNTTRLSLRQTMVPKQPSAASMPDLVPQAPLLSKKPKKIKPVTKFIKVPKEEEPMHEAASVLLSTSALEAPHFLSTNFAESSSNNSRSQSLDHGRPTSVEELLEEIDTLNPGMDLPNHPFFDLHKINPAAKMPLEYGPLVHALSALSVGGGSFANNMPSGSIDNAVSSFQQLLETLTQTISDLLRLLPRTTWDDSSSFDGVLRDMLKGDDFLDEGGEDGQGKEDEVAALTLALERRARWMEVQLSKLEELHRDINTAAVRAVLSFNDSGWDRHSFMPRVGNTLRRFNNIGIVEEGGVVRSMTADELEKKLIVAKEAAVFAETEVREAMEKMQVNKLMDVSLE